ncbi:MAG: hypothetical protein GF416_04380 [Candidatus Altiarchaeales archaeon]|nr:hypothetical protein [Candidatus Altiarchaeales archaeon]
MVVEVESLTVEVVVSSNVVVVGKSVVDVIRIVLSSRVEEAGEVDSTNMEPKEKMRSRER